MDGQNIDTKIQYGEENLKGILEKMLIQRFIEMFNQNK